MKKLIALPLLALTIAPSFAAVERTTTTRTYESMSRPANDRMYESRRIDDVEAQRMEERPYDRSYDRSYERRNYRADHRSADGIDYTDRTRTNRERKALDTSSDASDDR